MTTLTRATTTESACWEQARAASEEAGPPIERGKRARLHSEIGPQEEDVFAGIDKLMKSSSRYAAGGSSIDSVPRAPGQYINGETEDTGCSSSALLGTMTKIVPIRDAPKELDGFLQDAAFYAIPPGLMAVPFVVPEEVTLCPIAGLALTTWLKNHYGGVWPPWPKLRGFSQERYITARDYTKNAITPNPENDRWSVCTDAMRTDPETIVALLSLNVQRVAETQLLKMTARTIGFTHGRDLMMISTGTVLPVGSSEGLNSPAEIVSRVVIPKRLFSIEKRSAPRMLDMVFMDVAAGDKDPRPDMYDGFDGDGSGDDGGDQDYARDGSYNGGGQDGDGRTPEEAALDRLLALRGDWKMCQEHWRKMCSPEGEFSNYYARGHGWYYLVAPVGPPGFTGLMPPMLGSESASIDIMTLFKRTLGRLRFLWRIDEWNVSSDKELVNDLFGNILSFSSLNDFVVDRLCTELLAIGACIREDWKCRLARAEGGLSSKYVLWLDEPSEILRLVRSNEVYNKAFCGMRSRDYYNRIFGYFDSSSRGSVKADMASKIYHYVEKNVMERCNQWATLLQVNPETGVAEALAKLEEIDPFLAQCLPVVWNELNDHSLNNPLGQEEEVEGEGEDEDEVSEQQEEQ